MQFGENYQVVVSAKIWLDVMNAEASKGAAIKHLPKHIRFHLRADHELSVNCLNDLEILKESYPLTRWKTPIKAERLLILARQVTSMQSVFKVLEKLLTRLSSIRFYQSQLVNMVGFLFLVYLASLNDCSDWCNLYLISSLSDKDGYPLGIGYALSTIFGMTMSKKLQLDIISDVMCPWCIKVGYKNLL